MIYHGASGSLSDLDANVTCATDALREHADHFDFIAVCGMSGVVVGVPVALRLHKPLVIVRKETDENAHHNGGTLIGFDATRGRYVVVDDFKSSGRTVEFVCKKIAHNNNVLYNPPPEFVGFFSYADDAWSWSESNPLSAPCNPA